MYNHPYCKPTVLPRLSGFIVVTILLFVLLAFLAPQQLPVVAYKSLLVTLGAVLGYWIDRALFPYARPHNCMGDSLANALVPIRRALVVLACILGLTLGL